MEVVRGRSVAAARLDHHIGQSLLDVSVVVVDVQKRDFRVFGRRAARHQVDLLPRLHQFLKTKAYTVNILLIIGQLHELNRGIGLGTHPDDSIVVGARDCKRGGRGTRPSAEVRLITHWLQDPIVPANLLE